MNTFRPVSVGICTTAAAAAARAGTGVLPNFMLLMKEGVTRRVSDVMGGLFYPRLFQRKSVPMGSEASIPSLWVHGCWLTLPTN